MSTLTPSARRCRIQLLAVPESLHHVRRQLLEFLTDAGYTTWVNDTVRLAVSEACANVVLHAYGPESGPLRVEAVITPQAELFVSVRDEGRGFQAYDESPHTGFGLPLMASLADNLSIDSTTEGTAICLTFDLFGKRLLDEKPFPSGNDD